MTFFIAGFAPLWDCTQRSKSPSGPRTQQRGYYPKNWHKVAIENLMKRIDANG
jgi:hypothetical protein